MHKYTSIHIYNDGANRATFVPVKSHWLSSEEETVPVPCSPGPEGSEALARREQFKKTVYGLSRVL